MTNEPTPDETDGQPANSAEQPTDDRPPSAAYPMIVRMQQVVREHGEVHAVIEEHDAFDDGSELEVRQATTEFNYESGTLEVAGADTTHFVGMDRVVRFYPPMEIAH